MAESVIGGLLEYFCMKCLWVSLCYKLVSLIGRVYLLLSAGVYKITICSPQVGWDIRD